MDTIPTADELRASIRERVTFLTRSLDQLNNAIHSLSLGGIMVDTSRQSLSLPDVLECGVAAIIQKLCREVNSGFACGTPASVTLDPGYYSFPCARYRDHKIKASCGLTDGLRRELIEATICNHSTTLLVCRFVEGIDCESIISTLREQAPNLQRAGYGLHAASLVKHLHLAATGPFKPKVTARHVVFYKSVIQRHYFYQSEAEYRALIEALDVVAVQAGLCVGSALLDLCASLRNLTYSAPLLPPRSVFGVGAHLSIHCFKERYEFRFTHRAFDAMAAFINLYGSAEDLAAINTILPQLDVRLVG